MREQSKVSRLMEGHCKLARSGATSKEVADFIKQAIVLSCGGSCLYTRRGNRAA